MVDYWKYYVDVNNKKIKEIHKFKKYAHIKERKRRVCVYNFITDGGL
jgi:hypothetical protein